MDNLETITALNDAIRILLDARYRAAGGSMVIWALIDHAAKHLDAQIGDMLIERIA